MSIVQLIQIQGGILAVNNTGDIIYWDLKQIKTIQGIYKFEDNISLQPSQGSLKIDPQSLSGIELFQNIIIIYNQQTIYTSSIKDILQSIKDQKIRNIKTIKYTSVMQKKQIINCLTINNQSTIIIGTNKANIYLYNFIENWLINKISLQNQSQKDITELTIYATIPKISYEVNAISIYGDYAIVGLSNGKAYSIKTQNLEIMFQFTSKIQNNLEPIHKIIYSNSTQKAYFLHNTYITQWSIKLCACLSHIQYPHPVGLLNKNQRIIIIGNHSKLIWYDNKQGSINLSMRSAQTIKNLNHQLYAVAGSDNIIDIMSGTTRQMTLYHYQTNT